jgi:hypothetical protein
MEMHYQPIINLESGQVSHYEALLRLQDKDGKPCNAGELVKTSMMDTVFGLVLGTRCGSCSGSEFFFAALYRENYSDQEQRITDGICFKNYTLHRNLNDFFQTFLSSIPSMAATQRSNARS